MSSKHFVDDVKDLTLNALRGLQASNPNLVVLDPAHKVVFVPSQNRRVHLLSGGGSGHEPFAAGYVAPGMLDCAVSGDIFVRCRC